MGLSIHYNGRIKDPDLLPELIEEVKDICEDFKWEYFILDEELPKDNYGKGFYHPEEMYGICFTPPECETVPLCFLSNGRMSSLVNLRCFGQPANEEEKDYLYMLSVKTQFAGIQIHQVIIQLFRYLSEKYLADFNLMDEGEYWETGDENRLKERFRIYTGLLDQFSSALENIPKKGNETLENYIERLAQYLSNKRKQS